MFKYLISVLWVNKGQFICIACFKSKCFTQGKKKCVPTRKFYKLN